MQPLLKSSSPVDLRVSQYQDVKTRIHEQLLNRLNLERLSQIRREEAEPELRSVIGNPAGEGIGEDAAQPLRARKHRRRRAERAVRPRAARGAAARSGHLRHPREPVRPDLHRKERHARARGRGVQGRPPSDAHHRAHREHRGPAHRRIQPDGGRAPARRLACECGDSAARARRPRALDSAVPHRQARRQRPGEEPVHYASR